MSGKRVRRTRHSGFGFLLTAVALAAAVGLLGWWVVQLGDDDAGVLPAADAPSAGSGTTAAAEDPAADESPAGDARDGTDEGTADGASSTDDAAAAFERCAAGLDRVERALAAARPGIASWEAHVQARTDMLADRISEKRMEAIYDRTKHQGHVAQERFAEARAAVSRPRPCEGLPDGDGPAGGDRVADCATRSEAAGAALTAADSTMEEWQAHLHHMADYADGGMRSGKAMALWVKAWRKAPEGLRAYRDRAAELVAAPTCSVP